MTSAFGSPGHNQDRAVTEREVNLIEAVQTSVHKLLGIAVCHDCFRLLNCAGYQACVSCLA